MIKYMNIKRFFAVFKARNIEFFRDKSSLGWNLFFPVLLLIGFSFIFSGDGRSAYKVGIINDSANNIQQPADDKNYFESTRFIDFIYYEKETVAKNKLSRHTIDLVIAPTNKEYWVNNESSKKLFGGKGIQ